MANGDVNILNIKQELSEKVKELNVILNRAVQAGLKNFSVTYPDLDNPNCTHKPPENIIEITFPD